MASGHRATLSLHEPLSARLDVVEDEPLDDDEDTGDLEALGVIRRNATRLLRQTQELGALLVHMPGEKPT